MFYSNGMSFGGKVVSTLNKSGSVWSKRAKPFIPDQTGIAPSSRCFPCPSFKVAQGLCKAIPGLRVIIRKSKRCPSPWEIKVIYPVKKRRRYV